MKPKGTNTYYEYLLVTISFLSGVFAMAVLTNYLDESKDGRLADNIQKYTVSGLSMYAPYDEGDEILVHLNPKEYSRFDVIVFDTTIEGKNVTMIKRVIGLPNEEITYRDNVLYINNLEVRQEYADSMYYLTSDFTATTTDQCYFVLGDNRRHSVDSRELGCVPLDKIKGVVLE